MLVVLVVLVMVVVIMTTTMMTTSFRFARIRRDGLHGLQFMAFN